MFGWKNKIAPRRMPEASAACDGAVMKTRGILAGSQIATAMGWRAGEALAPGDLVLTFDNGLQPLIDVRRDTFWVADMMLPAAYASVMVPAGALGNAQELELLPDQGVLVETDGACDIHGDPFAVVPAKTLVGYRGITRVGPRTQVEVITLVFEDEQVVYADGGALLHCPRAHLRLCDLGIASGVYDVIPVQDASFLVECMELEDQIAATA